MFKKSIAKREKVKLMVGLTGPSGSGKTLSSLKLAYGITGDWKKIALADTENGSALYYAGEATGPWEHINFSSDIKNGYHPDNWVKLVEFVEKDSNIDVLILDSISHEWEGVGGCLDWHTSLGGRFQDWAKITPVHRAFIDKIRESRLHIIATMRSKTDYALEQNEKGRASVKKVGMKSTQREGTDYEFGIIFDVEINHYATATKDRTGLFAKRHPFIIDSETGRELKEWAASGAERVKEETPVILYEATNDQKIALMKWCQAENKASDATSNTNIVKMFSEFLKGKPFTDLDKNWKEFGDELRGDIEEIQSAAE